MSDRSTHAGRGDGFAPGIDTLLAHRRRWLAGRRIGLLSHAAAVDGAGCSSAERLRAELGDRLVCLLAPEHGYFGRAGAGEHCRSQRHPSWRIPIHSLYGATRAPTASMLRSLDTLVIDLQDIGARCYTYVSTLQCALQAATDHGKAVIVADRPIPLPNVIDGPLTTPACRSFVSLVDTPLAYGMTPGEAAVWLRRHLGLRLDLKIATMRGYRRDPGRGPDWPPWIPPSPGMRSWESAKCFPATVFAEAIGGLDHGRRTNLPFQLFGAAWLRGGAAVEALRALRLPGVRFYEERYAPDPREPDSVVLPGVRLAVVEPDRFRPALTAVAILAVLRDLYGGRRLWSHTQSRPEFFDKLMGADAVRLALQAGQSPQQIAAGWAAGVRAFNASREACLLYAREPRS